MSKSSRIIDGLKTNTLYSFYLRAKNSCGNWSAVSPVVTHTTLKDTTVPAVLSSITLLLLNGAIHLKWAKPTTLDLRGGGYKVYVYTSNTVASSKLIREVGYTDDSTEILVGEQTQDASITITIDTTYYFWVTTLDDSGNESAKVATTPASGKPRFKIIAKSGQSDNIFEIESSALADLFTIDASGNGYFSDNLSLQFRDANQYINSDDANYLDLHATTAARCAANLFPKTDNTYYLGKNDDDTPFAWKGVILKDTTNGKYYRVEVINGILTATDLTD